MHVISCAMYIDMCIYVYVYIYIYIIYVIYCAYIYIYIYMCVCIGIYMYIYIYVFKSYAIVTALCNPLQTSTVDAAGKSAAPQFSPEFLVGGLSHPSEK